MLHWLWKKICDCREALWEEAHTPPQTHTYTHTCFSYYFSFVFFFFYFYVSPSIYLFNNFTSHPHPRLFLPLLRVPPPHSLPLISPLSFKRRGTPIGNSSPWYLKSKTKHILSHQGVTRQPSQEKVT